MAAQLCKECGTRPKAPGRHRCATCQLRQMPIGDQVAASRVRLAMVPEELRLSRRAGQKHARPGRSFCAGCQSFRDDADFGTGATKCRACASSVSHSARLEKVYGIDAAEYERLLRLQGGRCAVCRARPKSKRLAVDHDHKTGAVLGLLCSRCNHDLKGSAWDSLAMATALWHYMNTPPTSGDWLPPEEAPRLMAATSAERPADGGKDVSGVFARPGAAKRSARNAGPEVVECARPHVLPAGSKSVPGKRGVWRVFVEDGGDPPF